MNTDNTITGRDLHRIHSICDACETVAHCRTHGCIPPVDEAADTPLVTPQQAMAYVPMPIPMWLLVVVASFLCFVYVVTNT
jgi:hypothetical protein